MDKKKPLVGVMSLVDKDKDSIWMVPGYMNGILESGGIPVIFPLTTDKEILKYLCEKVDGILFTGGDDINPLIYSDNVHETCQESNEIRDEEEIYLMKKMFKLDKPILGICRGMQLLNVVCGGTLYQDIPSQIDTEIIHKQGKPYDKGTHEVYIKKHSKLYNKLQKDKICVNTLHHQCVKDLGKDVIPVAVAPDDIVEAIEIAGCKFALGVQWHPEFLYKNDENSRKIFELFIEAMM